MTAEEEEEARKRIKEVVTARMAATDIGKALNLDGRTVRRLARVLVESGDLAERGKDFAPA